MHFSRYVYTLSSTKSVLKDLIDGSNSDKNYSFCLYSTNSDAIFVHTVVLITLTENMIIHLDFLISKQFDISAYPVALLVLILIFIVMNKNYQNIFLEVHSENLVALSLYYWLGSKILHQRFDYYDYTNKSLTAYTLNNKFLFSKNLFRSFLILSC